MIEENYIREKELPNQPQAIPIKEMIILLNLIKTNICKIYCKDGSHGTGFFCNIPNGWGNYLSTLITNNHVLNEEDIKPDQTIKFSIDNDIQFFNILIDNTRKTYTDESYDVTIIEIKEEDKIEQKSFFDLDKQIFQEKVYEILRNCQIYLLHYPKGKEMEISPGIIKNINEDNKNIYHLCDSSGGSSGSPIINKNNFQVIGIHKGAAEKGKNYNLGTLLKEPVEKFSEAIKMKINNNINNSNHNSCNFNYTKENEKNEKIEEKKEIINEGNEKNIKIKEKGEKINEENKKINANTIIENINDKKNLEKNKELMENSNENINEIIIRYKIDNIKHLKDIRIFGGEFVKNNKNICKIIINGNEFELCKTIDININQLENNIFELKLKGIKNVTNMSYIFSKCNSLSSSSDISKWNTENVNNMSYMFFYCDRLNTLPDISKFNTQNVTNMSYMFYNCESLSFLPDISKWNTRNVTNMSFMFDKCKSLSSLPDISQWDTQNVITMRFMFVDCKSLLSLPDISKWDTQNVTTMESMFAYCKSLSSLPDISKCNTQKVTSFYCMFEGCDKKLNIPKKFKSKCFIF